MSKKPLPPGIRVHDFFAHLPSHKYIFDLTGEMWPDKSINGALPPVALTKPDGTPVVDKDGKQKMLGPAHWLDTHRAVHALSWQPGEPQVIFDKAATEGGWVARKGVMTFNLYKPPPPRTKGNANNAGRWVELVRKVYPEGADRIIRFMSHRIQKPGEKINHGLVLAGTPGIGKDTILKPLEHGVGAWNFKEIAPADITGPYNDYMRSVVLRISEARDLGEVNRFAFHNRTLTILAAPPDMVRINPKYVPQHYIPNLTAAIFTTNHSADGLYLPLDDRRHDVHGTEVVKEDFTEDYWLSFWHWYHHGGLDDVVALLDSYDISKFDPKQPPVKTAAFWRMADSGVASEVPELRDALDKIGKVDADGKPVLDKAGNRVPPDAVTLNQVMLALDRFEGELHDWLKDRKNRPAIKHRFESCGYIPVRNTTNSDGMWVLYGRRQVIYGRTDLGEGKRFKAAEALKRAADEAVARQAKAEAERAANATEQENSATERAKQLLDGITGVRRQPKS